MPSSADLYLLQELDHKLINNQHVTQVQLINQTRTYPSCNIKQVGNVSWASRNIAITSIDNMLNNGILRFIFNTLAIFEELGEYYETRHTNYLYIYIRHTGNI